MYKQGEDLEKQKRVIRFQTATWSLGELGTCLFVPITNKIPARSPAAFMHLEWAVWFGFLGICITGFFREINSQVFACHHMTSYGAEIDVISNRHTSENLMWFRRIQYFINSSFRVCLCVCVLNEPQGVLNFCQGVGIIRTSLCWAAPQLWWRTAKSGCP